MNKKATLLFALVISVTLLTSCEPAIEYKYQDMPQPVNCSGADKALMHEALYSFQQDIAKGHNFRNYDPASPIYIINGYRKFIYFGFSGESDYKKLISPHTKKVFEELLKENIWTDKEGYSHLDYNSSYVSCLLDNIKSPDIRATINSLKEVNSLGPKLMAEPLRRAINEVAQDPHLAMYIALDGYYQYLIDVDLSEPIENE